MQGFLTRAESRALRMTGKTEAARSWFDYPALYVIPSEAEESAKRNNYNKCAFARILGAALPLCSEWQ